MSDFKFVSEVNASIRKKLGIGPNEKFSKVREAVKSVPQKSRAEWMRQFTLEEQRQIQSLFGSVTLARWYESVQSTPATPDFLVIIKEKSKIDFADKSELKFLRSAQEKWERIQKFLQENTSQAARKAIEAQNQQLVEHIANGTFTEALQLDAWTRDDFEEDFEQKRRFAFEGLRKLSAEINPTFKAIAERVSKAAFKCADMLEEFEQEHAHEWHYAFRPSDALVKCGKLTWKAFEYVPNPNNSSVSPAQFLKQFGITL